MIPLGGIAAPTNFFVNCYEKSFLHFEIHGISSILSYLLYKNELHVNDIDEDISAVV